MATVQLNLGLLQQAVKRNPKYEKAYRIFAKRQRGRFEITFRRFGRVMDAEGERWTPEEINDYFELQQESGAGSIIHGKDTPSFIFNVHLQDLACAVLGLPSPKRKNKGWSSVRSEAGHIARPTPRRKPALPKVSERASDHVLSGVQLAPANVLPFQATRAGVQGQTVRLKKDGFEIEVDLDKLTPDACAKLTSLLTTLKK